MDSKRDSAKQTNRTIFCRYSGIPLPSYPDFPSLQIEYDSHIIMRAPFHLLISEVEKRKVLTDRQQRLLFIAFLKSTDLCIFESPALPSERIIEQEFSRMIEIAYYIHGHRSFYQTFPRFKISKKDPSISNLPYILNTWYDVKSSHTWTREQRKELQDLEDAEELEQKVTRAVLSKKVLSPIFNKHLIKWALTASFAPEGKRIKWAKIFLTKDDRMCRLCRGHKLLLNPVKAEMETCPSCEGLGKTSDIDKLSFKETHELRNYMVDSLPEETSYESSRKMAVLRHLAGKIQKIRNLHASFGIDTISEIPQTDEEKARGKIAEEPVRGNFPNQISYLTALAQFRAAQANHEEIEDQEGDSYLNDSPHSPQGRMVNSSTEEEDSEIGDSELGEDDE